MPDGVLPPLPPSDRDALDKNKYDGYYKVKSRDFWGENEINRVEEEPMKKCDHEFIKSVDGVKCVKCHFGLIGSTLTIQDKKLFFKGEPIGL
jgi:hypothetical protein